MGLPTLQQALVAVASLAGELGPFLAMMNGFTVRSLMAQGVSFSVAIKQLISLRRFWAQVVCTIIALIGMVLIGPQNHPILTNIQNAFLVVFATTVVGTAAGFWMAGMGLAENKNKSSKTSNDV